MWTVIITILRRNFSRRGFQVDRGDRLAELIVKGSRCPGFAFLQVLSPWVTFRPERARLEVHDTVGGVSEDRVPPSRRR